MIDGNNINWLIDAIITKNTISQDLGERQKVATCQKETATCNVAFISHFIELSTY